MNRVNLRFVNVGIPRIMKTIINNLLIKKIIHIHVYKEEHFKWLYYSLILA